MILPIARQSSRIFLKEKFTIVALTSTFLAILGIVFIQQPSFLFKNTSSPSNLSQEEDSHLVQTNYSATIKAKSRLFGNSSLSIGLLKTIGLLIALINAFAKSGTAIIIKKLSAKNVHYSLHMLVTSCFGLAICALLSVVLNYTGNSNFVHNAKNNFPNFMLHIFYSFLSGTIGLIAQIVLNFSLRYEEASKVSIIKTAEIFLSFLLQYIFLNIKANVLKVIGSVLITVSGVAILVYKIFDQKHSKKRHKYLELEGCDENQKSEHFCKRILFFKF